jgi:hypothetical protein
MTRGDAFNLTDTELLVALDRCRLALRRAWDRGEPGSLIDVYDMGVMYAEAHIRGCRIAAPVPAGWLLLFDPDEL